MADLNSTRDFYVYVHRRKTDESVFYVGKGYGRRAWSKDRNKFWHSVAKKHGYTVEIVQYGMLEWWAFEMEIELISYYGRDNLCNMTDGGEGSSGTICSEETKLKKSIKSKGRKHSLETLEKMSLIQSNRSVETRLKISKAKKGISRPKHVIDAIVKAHSKPVVCIETNITFTSCVDATYWLHSIGLTKAQGRPISDASKGKYKKAYGYHWKYA